MPDNAKVTSQSLKRSSTSSQKDALHGLHTDLHNLRQIGRSRGFPSRLRRKIWLILLGIEENTMESHTRETCLEPHRDEKQVALDVNRAFTTALPKGLEASKVPSHKKELESLIVRVLRQYPWLHYYQGYHDIAQFVHLVLGNAAEAGLAKISLIFLRDFMLSSLEPSMSMLRLVHQIVRVADPDYAHLLSSTEPYYAISTLLTWWTHSLQTFHESCRIMDFFLSSDPDMILYTIAAATLAKRKEIIEIAGDSDLIFVTLNKGMQDVDLEAVLQSAVLLSDSVRPRQLQHWKSISPHSCLKTIQTAKKLMAVSIQNDWQIEAEKHFHAQEDEIEDERRRRLLHETSSKMPAAGRLGIVAVSVGILALGVAWYAQKQGVLNTQIPFLRRVSDI